MILTTFSRALFQTTIRYTFGYKDHPQARSVPEDVVSRNSNDRISSSGNTSSVSDSEPTRWLASRKVLSGASAHNVMSLENWRSAQSEITIAALISRTTGAATGEL
jgi:hypothetical protein